MEKVRWAISSHISVTICTPISWCPLDTTNACSGILCRTAKQTIIHMVAFVSSNQTLRHANIYQSCVLSFQPNCKLDEVNMQNKKITWHMAKKMATVCITACFFYVQGHFVVVLYLTDPV